MVHATGIRLNSRLYTMSVEKMPLHQVRGFFTMARRYLGGSSMASVFPCKICSVMIELDVGSACERPIKKKKRGCRDDTLHPSQVAKGEVKCELPMSCLTPGCGSSTHPEKRGKENEPWQRSCVQCQCKRIAVLDHVCMSRIGLCLYKLLDFWDNLGNSFIVIAPIFLFSLLARLLLYHVMGCFSDQTASFRCSCQVVMGLTNIPTHKLRCRCTNIVMRREVLKGALCSNVPISTRFAWWKTQVASARFSTNRWHQKG